MEQKTSGRALVVGGDSLVGSALQVHCRKLGLTVDASSRRAEARHAHFGGVAELRMLRAEPAGVEPGHHRAA